MKERKKMDNYRGKKKKSSHTFRKQKKRGEGSRQGERGKEKKGGEGVGKEEEIRRSVRIECMGIEGGGRSKERWGK